MCITTPRRVVNACVDELNHRLAKDRRGQGRSRWHSGWLACCLTGMLVTHSVCGATCARARLGTYSRAA